MAPTHLIADAAQAASDAAVLLTEGEAGRLLLLAQLGADVEWLKVFVNIGALGLVAWVLVYVFKTLIPRLLDQFTADLKAQRVEFREELKLQREEFADELKLERESRREMAATVARIADTCGRAGGGATRRDANGGG